MINKILIILLLFVIIINLSYYENFDNNFNKNTLEKYEKEINSNLEILNNLIKKVKSKISSADINKDRKISKINETTNKTYAKKNKVQGFLSNAGLTN